MLNDEAKLIYYINKAEQLLETLKWIEENDVH